MYTAVFIVSLVGNGLVCYVVMSSTQMQSATNMFIMNMAVGDLVMTLFCVPFPFVTSFLLQYWPLGNYLCQTFTFGKIVAVLVSHIWWVVTGRGLRNKNTYYLGSYYIFFMKKNIIRNKLHNAEWFITVKYQLTVSM